MSDLLIAAASSVITVGVINEPSFFGSCVSRGELAVNAEFSWCRFGDTTISMSCPPLLICTCTYAASTYVRMQ